MEGLLDSNVLVAGLVRTHEHHELSAALLLAVPLGRFACAAHSFAEAYVTLTRSGPRSSFNIEPSLAIAMLQSAQDSLALVGLSPTQTIARLAGTRPAAALGHGSTTRSSERWPSRMQFRRSSHGTPATWLACSLTGKS